jgi:Tol biopolymer transport system component
VRRLFCVLTAAAVLAACAGAASNQARGAFPGLNRKIAFVSSRDGNAEIHVTNAAGTVRRRSFAVNLVVGRG